MVLPNPQDLGLFDSDKEFEDRPGSHLAGAQGIVHGGQASAGPYVAAAPEALLGQKVGSGQCVAYVEVAANAPHTAEWKRGTLVKGADANILPGTVIATFDADGTYGNHSDGTSHAAIYLSQDNGGLTVYDQWFGQAVHRRLIRFSPPAPPGAKPVNDGSKFYVVV